jgi:HK97 family phage portal protein
MIGGQLVSRVGSWLMRAAEGAYRPGPYYLPVTGGWLSHEAGQYMNWWQLGYDPTSVSSQSAMVEACISAYAQTVAMLPGDHWRLKTNGGRERVTTSALSRILRHPNEYQSISDFMLNATRSLYMDGNAYALALRNDRFEIDELHLMDPRQSMPQVAVTGDVFYRLAGNDVIDRQVTKPLIVPARDVLHIRLHCIDRKRPFPLIGETPLTAALMDMAAGNAIQQQQIQFYLNQARPSAVLSTDQVLRQEQVEQLRQMWNEQSKGLEAGCGPGGTPILTAGLKVQPWATPGKDAQVAEVMKMSDEKIALAFRVPLQILGIGGTPYSSTELLLQSWLASGLGFALAHIEEAFGLLFKLKGVPDEYVEFDTAALLRSATKERIESLVRGVQGGVYSPDEAREMEGLPAVPGGFGTEPRVQAQVVPLSAAAGIPSAPAAPGPGGGLPSASAVSTGEDAPKDDKDDEDEPPEKKPRKSNGNYVRTILAEADRYDRHIIYLRDFCQDPETGLLCGSEPSGGSDSGGGGKEDGETKPESSASSLAKPVSKTVDQVVAAVPASKPKIESARTRLAQAVPTDAPVEKGGHKQANGNYTPARIAIQQRVVQSIMTPEAIAAAVPKAGEKPTLHILGGRGGSGKSFFTSKKGTIDKSKFLYLNNDDIKEKLPEYAGWNAAMVHEESSHIGSGIEAAARDAKLNVIIDGTMKSAGVTEQRIAAFKAAGYRIEGHYMYTSPENSAQRALERFVRGGETGRFVPPEYSLSSTTNEASFDKVKGQMDAWEIYDNDGSAPKFHARSK